MMIFAARELLSWGFSLLVLRFVLSFFEKSCVDRDQIRVTDYEETESLTSVGAVGSWEGPRTKQKWPAPKSQPL